MHFDLLETHSSPGRKKGGILLSKMTLWRRKPTCSGDCWLPIFWKAKKQIKQLETEFALMHYLNSKIVSSMYLQHLRLHWEAVTDATEPMFVLKQCFTLLKGGRKPFLIQPWEVFLEMLVIFSHCRYSSYWATGNLLQIILYLKPKRNS